MLGGIDKSGYKKTVTRGVNLKYKVIRTETADAHIRKIILYVAENFGNEVALKKLEELEQSILELGIHPSMGLEPRYLVLKRQNYLNIVRGL